MNKKHKFIKMILIGGGTKSIRRGCYLWHLFFFFFGFHREFSAEESLTMINHPIRETERKTIENAKVRLLLLLLGMRKHTSTLCLCKYAFLVNKIYANESCAFHFHCN